MECKTVTAREIKQITETFVEKEKYITWHGKRIKVNPLLSVVEVFELLNNIKNGCTKQPDNLIVIEAIDFVFKAKTIEAYTSIVLPEQIDDQYKTIYSTDLVNVVFESVNQAQLQSIKKMVSAYSGMDL